MAYQLAFEGMGAHWLCPAILCWLGSCSSGSSYCCSNSGATSVHRSVRSKRASPFCTGRRLDKNSPTEPAPMLVTCQLLACELHDVVGIFSIFATCIFDNSAKGLACLMSDVGQYELAERIYRSAPDLNENKASGRYSSMAAWHSSSTHEHPNILRMKNAAVAAVYSSQSRQMAGRYFYLGLTCEQGRENRDPEAIYWHNKALSLYQQNHAITKCMDALAQMAILQDVSNKQQSKRLIAQAARLAPSIDEEPYVCTPIIQYLAQRNGDKEQSELFRRSFEKPPTSAESKPLWPIVSLTLFAIFGSGFGCLLANDLSPV